MRYHLINYDTWFETEYNIVRGTHIDLEHIARVDKIVRVDKCVVLNDGWIYVELWTE